jgi:hypothetical protein
MGCAQEKQMGKNWVVTENESTAEWLKPSSKPGTEKKEDWVELQRKKVT